MWCGSLQCRHVISARLSNNSLLITLVLQVRSAHVVFCSIHRYTDCEPCHSVDHRRRHRVQRPRAGLWLARLQGCGQSSADVLIRVETRVAGCSDGAHSNGTAYLRRHHVRQAHQAGVSFHAVRISCSQSPQLLHHTASDSFLIQSYLSTVLLFAGIYTLLYRVVPTKWRGVNVRFIIAYVPLVTIIRFLMLRVRTRGC